MLCVTIYNCPTVDMTFYIPVARRSSVQLIAGVYATAVRWHTMSRAISGSTIISLVISLASILGIIMCRRPHCQFTVSDIVHEIKD